MPELLLILVLALLLFGPKRLPEIGRTIGKGMAEFRKATNDFRRTIETEIALEEAPKKPVVAKLPPRADAGAPTAAAFAEGILPPGSSPAAAAARAEAEASEVTRTPAPTPAPEPAAAAPEPAADGDDSPRPA